MTGKGLRRLCEHAYMLAVGFFLMWNIPYMTEVGWTFSVREAFPAVWLGLAAAALVLMRFRPGPGGWLLALLGWMTVSSAYRGLQVLDTQLMMIARGVMAFGVILPAPRIVRWERLVKWLKVILALWTACMTLQAIVGLWAALTGHAVFSLRGSWYIGVNLGDHRLYLNAYVTTGAVKLGLSVLLAAVGAAVFRKRIAKAFFVLCLLVMLACLSLTDCRTAFIAVGCALGLMLAVTILRPGRAGENGRYGWLRPAAAASAVILVTVAAYAALSGLLMVLSPCVPRELDNLTLQELPARLLPAAAAEGAVQHRPLEAGNLFNDRQIIWRSTLRLLCNEPKFLVTGTTTALSSMLTNLYVLPAEYTGRPFAHVHNIYLQTMVSWGVPGLLLLGGFLFAFLCAARRVMLRHALPLWQRFAPAPVLYVMLCEMVDCFTRFSEESPMLLYACLFAGLTLSIDRRAVRQACAERPLDRPVDVIIPVYNAVGYVRRAAASVLSTPGARLILVDDGSTDGSGEVCDELAADARVTVLHQENRGAAAARNAGLAAATADEIAFLDADDVLLPGGLAALQDCMDGVDAVQGAVLRREPEALSGRKIRRVTGREAIGEALSDPTRHLLCHGWLFRRNILTEPFNESLTLGEDGEWLLRTLAHAAHVSFCSASAYRYTVRADSALHGAAEAETAYLRMLEEAAPALAALDMPQEAALFRLTHLLLTLTHGDLSRMETLRDMEPYASAFMQARLRGLSPRIVTLRLLRRRAYPLARGIIRMRRRMNRLSGAAHARAER